jgi:hypothetical protein
VNTMRFDRFAAEVVAVALLAGCSVSQLPSSTQTTALGAKGNSSRYVYVSNEIKSNSSWESSVNVYQAGRNGDVTPSAVIYGSATQLTQVNGIVVDSSGEIYVADTDTNEIVGFAPGTTGNEPPNVVIAGSNTQLAWPVGLALDSKDDLYVGNCASTCAAGSSSASILEFAAGSNGNVAPMRSISGSESKLADANDPALDTAGNIYVCNWTNNTIDVFAANASGNEAPIRVIAGLNTLLQSPDGIAVDRWLYAGSGIDDYLERFRRTAHGNVPPVAIVSGRKTGIGNVDGIALDSQGVLYVSSPDNKRILKFSALASGNERPVGRIQGPNTKLVSPVWVYVR